MMFGLTDINGNVSGYPSVFVYGANGKLKFLGGGGGTGTVTSIATAGLISGGTITTTGTITTLMNTNKLVGRGTAGAGVMEEITIGSGLSLSAGTLSATAAASDSLSPLLLMGG